MSDPDLLAQGELSLHGRLVAASNGTFQGSVSLDGETATVVYKPVQGERPLWDFPDGTLAQREFAAYVVSEALGWSVVPPTLLREGPLGEGMVQLWIDEAELGPGRPSWSTSSRRGGCRPDGSAYSTRSTGGTTR